jgi:hypothetical protein
MPAQESMVADLMLLQANLSRTTASWPLPVLAVAAECQPAVLTRHHTARHTHSTGSGIPASYLHASSACCNLWCPARMLVLAQLRTHSEPNSDSSLLPRHCAYCAYGVRQIGVIRRQRSQRILDFRRSAIPNAWYASRYDPSTLLQYAKGHYEQTTDARSKHAYLS